MGRTWARPVKAATLQVSNNSGRTCARVTQSAHDAFFPATSGQPPPPAVSQAKRRDA